jgi:hypothetical protein
MALTKEEEDLNRKKLQLQRRYNQRITIARHGREFFLAKDYISAAKKYNEYLNILAEMKEIKDIYQLRPNMFDEKNDLTEMLLISHIYWELARINELTPKLQKNFQMALNQFIRFTINQPFQVLNAEMLRKYIKKNKGKSSQMQVLTDAYNKIFTESKKCYISTHCFGKESQITEDLRLFKNYIAQNKFGIYLIKSYYLYSSQLVEIVPKHKKTNLIFIIIAKPTLLLIRFFIKLFRFQKCF